MKKTLWYVLLIAVYPPLALLAENITEVGFLAANRAIVFSILVALLLLMILARVYKNWQKAGFVSSLFILLIFSYGHIYTILENVEVVGILVGRHRYLMALWLILTVLVILLAGKIRQFSTFEEVIRIVSFALFVFVGGRLFIYSIAEWQIVRSQSFDETATQINRRPSDKILPDVYYIILDAYGRSDVLANNFDVDSADFLDSLRSMGFFVASCSQSNYAHTLLSLASSLNYRYLDDLGSDFVPGNTSWSNLKNLIQNSATRQFFEENNYKVIAFETGYAWTEWRDADLFIENKASFFSKNLTAFEVLFLHTTTLAVAYDFGWIPDSQQNIQHFELISSSLHMLDEKVAEEDSPKFVFAHLVIPHHPFVFDMDGKYRRDSSLSPAFENYSDEEYREGYREQVIYINARILELVDNVLSKSERPTIIVIQGDHGPSHAGESARMSIFNAYYLPSGPVDQLRDYTTPVNSFRVILNVYFNQNLPILPDRSYFSKNADPYTYTEILNECNP